MKIGFWGSLMNLLIYKKNMLVEHLNNVKFLEIEMQKSEMRVRFTEKEEKKFPISDFICTADEKAFNSIKSGQSIDDNSLFKCVNSINFASEHKQALIHFNDGNMRVLSNFNSLICE